jgi:hypothetical protein
MDSFGARMRQLILGVGLIGLLCLQASVGGIASGPNGNLSVLVVTAFPKGGTPRHESISPALLAYYYEHFREHAPPRQPGGAMQKREAFYRAPADPFELVESRLGDGRADRLLKTDLAQIRSSWILGTPPDSLLLKSLREHAAQCSVTAETLLEAARGVQWLIGEAAADAFFAAGLQKARDETSQHPSDRYRGSQLTHLLDQCGCLWRCDDPPALVDRFTVARRLTFPQSIESRRAGYLLAESLLADERRQEAADLILQVLEEHAKVGDLDRLDDSNRPEMNFVAGFILFHAGRYGDAIKFLASVDGEHLKEARLLLFESYLHIGDFQRAQFLSGVPIKPGVQMFSPETTSQQLTEELNRARWRAEIGAPPDQRHE